MEDDLNKKMEDDLKKKWKNWRRPEKNSIKNEDDLKKN
jgi:hypothetical protein